jgi:hypothetical protein
VRLVNASAFTTTARAGEAPTAMRTFVSEFVCHPVYTGNFFYVFSNLKSVLAPKLNELWLRLKLN